MSSKHLVLNENHTAKNEFGVVWFSPKSFVDETFLLQKIKNKFVAVEIKKEWVVLKINVSFEIWTVQSRVSLYLFEQSTIFLKSIFFPTMCCVRKKKRFSNDWKVTKRNKNETW